MGNTNLICCEPENSDKVSDFLDCYKAKNAREQNTEELQRSQSNKFNNKNKRNSINEKVRAMLHQDEKADKEISVKISVSLTDL